MTFYTSTLQDDNSFNCSGSENTTEHLPSFSQIYNIFNDILDGLSLWNFDENSYSLNISNENDKKHDNSKPIFKTELTKKKRGPIKIQESKKAEHNEWSYDNITSKIQVHYLNFIISFLNDCVNSFFGKKEFIFLNIDYKQKSKVTKAHLEKMKDSTILDILKNIDISNK